MVQQNNSAEEFDYVVVGAGSSGCVLAARLAEDGRSSVAVLEAGRRQWPDVTAIPAALLLTIGRKNYDWQYVSQPDPTRNGRSEPWPRGRGPGGSGLINGMIFVRGAAGDYDAWRDLGAAGWGYSDVLPYFRRFERSEIGGDQYRGDLGPQSVSRLRYVHPTTDLFIAAANAAGVPLNEDYNAAVQDGVGRTQAFQRNGRRHSSYDSFLREPVRRGRVRLIQDAHAQQVLFEGRVARGVAYRTGGETRRIRARQLVVLCGGAINTPQLLQLSGIGPAAELAALGVKPLVDSPAVGANLMEHVGVFLRAEVDVPSLNREASGARRALALLRWLSGRGPATTPTAQAVGFHRTAPGLTSADVQLHFTAFGFTGPLETDPSQQLVMIAPSVNHPRSRGRVALASADPSAAPLICPRLLDAPEDLATLRRGLRLAYQILASPPLSRRVRRVLDNEGYGLPDSELDAYLRAVAGPLYHPVGTCRMGSDTDAVVAPDLRVRGVERLAVADVSIMPRHISGNTHAAAMMIGEKAADLFRTP